TVVINEAAARAYWSGRNPIGASARLSAPDGDRFEVVGVVGDVRNNGLNKPAVPAIYLSAAVLAVNAMNVVVRWDLPTDQLIGAVRRSIRQTDPTVVMNGVRTMNDVVRDTLQLERLSSLLMTFFGLAALLMATLGVYGVVSYFVRQRTVELGTRMALGAVNRDLVALVLGGGLKLSLAGIAAGSVALDAGVPLPRRRRRARKGPTGRGRRWIPDQAAARLSAAAAVCAERLRRPRRMGRGASSGPARRDSRARRRPRPPGRAPADAQRD